MTDQLPTSIMPAGRMLTAAEFHQLAEVPPEVEWFANPTNPSTRRAYENAVRDFMRFAGIERAAEFRTVTRAHAITWRDELVRRGLGGSTIRHRLASLASAAAPYSAYPRRPRGRPPGQRACSRALATAAVLT
jgi:integrase/recombinase XerD